VWDENLREWIESWVKGAEQNFQSSICKNYREHVQFLIVQGVQVHPSLIDGSASAYHPILESIPG